MAQWSPSPCERQGGRAVSTKGSTGMVSGTSDVARPRRGFAAHPRLKRVGSGVCAASRQESLSCHGGHPCTCSQPAPRFCSTPDTWSCVSGNSMANLATRSSFLQLRNYEAPTWAKGKIALTPKSAVHLGVLPTPIHRWNVPGVPDGVELFIKRDDLSGMQLSGNKVRKLEFLMAEALAEGADCVITIGGIQSNHCRGTAVAARYLGLDCHLLLRHNKALLDQDPGLTGNLLVERMVGAHVHLHSKEDYARVGSERLGAALADRLRQEGRRPYFIPVGGSNALGLWGYVQSVAEMEGDIRELGITDVAAACGSGATLGGLALGSHLAGLGCRVSAYGVCDDEDYFYDFVDGLFRGAGADVGPSRALMRCVQAKGLGYAMSAEDELCTIRDVALATGVLLDPVYSGKALHVMLREMQADPAAWRGRKVLFVHTGGLLGMYDKVAQLQPLVQGLGRVHRFDAAGL